MNYLDETGRLETLPAELRMTAKLRRENPSLSLSELGDQMNPPVSKSGIRNRLNRILGITAEYRKKDENGAGELPG